MRSILMQLGLSSVLLCSISTLQGNQIVLPGSILIAGTGRDNDPSAAFNTVDRTWLVVWRETFANNPFQSTVLGRIVREDRTILTGNINLGGGEDATPPRVAHDPLRNEWMVVFGNQVSDTTGFFSISARKVTAAGAVIDTGRGISAGNSGEAFPDVAAGRADRRGIGFPSVPFFLAIWQQTISGQPAIVALNLFDDAAAPGRIGFTGAPFRVDVGAELPLDRRSSRPRVSERAPLGAPSGGALFSAENHPRIAFELESAGQKDIYLAEVNRATVFGVVRVTATPENEDSPEVAWNETSDRTLILYHRGASGIRGQLTERTAAAPFHALVGDDFAVAPGSQTTLAAQAGSDIFFASADNAGSFGLGCIAGRRVVGTPAAGASSGGQLFLSPTTAGNVLLAFRRPDATGATIVRTSILITPPPALTNTAPAALAGSDLEVAEGTLFSLDGSASSDANGDPLRFQWSRTDGGDPGDFFVTAVERAKANPQLLAPPLGPGLTPIALTFELRLDDFRTIPAFASSDTVTVTVVPGTDPRPPAANAGGDLAADEGAGVALDGSASSDPDGDPLSFSWSLITVQPPLFSPGSVALAGSDTARPTFTAPRFANPGGIDLTFRLTVTTPRGGQGEDTVVVHERDTINERPVADARGPATAKEGTAFALDGSASSDPNGDDLTFSWRLASPLVVNGSLRETVFIQGADTPAPQVTANVFAESQMTFELTVRDPGGLESSAQVAVRVQPLPMQVTSILPPAGSPGTRVAINGVSLDSPGIRVFFGPEDFTHSARIESITDRQLVVIVPPAGPRLQRVLTNGRHLRGMIATEFFGPDPAPITVVKGSERFVSAQEFVSPHMEIFEAWLTQGVELYSLVQGKATLLHVRVRTAAGPQTPLPGLTLTPTGTVPLGASCTAFPAGAAAFQVPPANVPATALARTASVTELNQAVNFFLTPSQTLAPSFRFEVHLFNNGVEVASLRTEEDSLPFTRTHVPRFLVLHVVPFLNNGVDPAWTAAKQAAHQAKVDAAFAAFGRIYPFTSFAAQDHVVFNPNLTTLSTIIGDDGKIQLQDFELSGAFFDQLDAFNTLGLVLDSFNSSRPASQKAQFVVAMIADELRDPASTVGGVAIPPIPMMADIIRFSLEQKVGPADDVVNFVLDLVGAAVCVATFGIFCEDPFETILKAVLALFDFVNFEVVGNISLVIADDEAGVSLAQEVGHNLGMVNPFEIFHDGASISHSRINESTGPSFFGAPSSSGLVLNSGPVLNTVQAEAALFLPQGPLPKSVMARVAGVTNRNGFFEPNHFQRVFNAFRADGGGGGAAEAEARAVAGGGAGGGGVGSALYVAGIFSFLTGELRVDEARPALPEEPVSRQMTGSPLSIAFLAAGGATLAEHPIFFNLSVPVHTHGEGANEGLDDIAAFFRAVAEIPVGTASAEIRFQEKVLWTRSALGAAPEIAILAPAGGEAVAPEAELVVRWRSADADGDELTHGVFYSRDGGATFVPLAVSVRGSEFRWATGAAAGSESAVVKVVAHDGFHSAEAVSAVFALGGGRPAATILGPVAGATPISSRPLALSGLGHAPGGAAVTNDGAYRWSSSVAGALGEGREILAGPLAAGTHRLRLEVTVGGETASAEVEVTVLSDRDGDGTGDAAEIAAGLDPDNAEDVSLDEDEDGLATGPEVLVFASDPRQADTDGDGLPDGQEILQGTSPTQRDTDGDGRPDSTDNCPSNANPDQADRDRDGLGDLCDLEEAPVFHRGDSNTDGTVDISDAVAVLGYLFLGGSPLRCLEAANANDDTYIDLSDGIYILNFLFTGGPVPPSPGAPPNPCGQDPGRAEASHGCQAYDRC